MQELQEIKLFSYEEQSFHYGFNEKLCKINVFDAYPTLETCEEFLNNR